jgi:hypothetical protein
VVTLRQFALPANSTPRRIWNQPFDLTNVDQSKVVPALDEGFIRLAIPRADNHLADVLIVTRRSHRRISRDRGSVQQAGQLAQTPACLSFQFHPRTTGATVMQIQSELRQTITNTIIDALLDGGLPPWRQPWRCSKNAGPPINVISK